MKLLFSRILATGEICCFENYRSRSFGKFLNHGRIMFWNKKYSRELKLEMEMLHQIQLRYLIYLLTESSLLETSVLSLLIILHKSLDQYLVNRNSDSIAV